MLCSNTYGSFFSFYIQVFNPLVLLNLMCVADWMDVLFYGLVFMVVRWINIYPFVLLFVCLFFFLLFLCGVMRLFLLCEETEMPMEFMWASESFESLIAEWSSHASNAEGS